MLKRFLSALAGQRKPDTARAQIHLAEGHGAMQQGSQAVAIEHFAKAVECDPTMGVAYLYLALMQIQSGQLDAALKASEDGIAAAPGMPELHITRADALIAAGRVEEAIAAYETGIEAAGSGKEPAVEEARLSLANALLAAAREAEAEAIARDLLQRHPEAAIVLLELLGRILLAQNRLRESLECTDRILQIDPHHVATLNLRGQILQKQNDPTKAIAAYKKALQIKPDLYQAHCNLGSAYEMQQRYAQARAQYERCLDLLAGATSSPDYAIASFNLALLDLKHGDFVRGWQRYEYRWHMPSFRENLRALRQPLWLGDYDVAGHSILVYFEQGLGDTLQFVRYVEQLARMGADVVLEVQPQLKDLIKQSFGHMARDVLARGESLPETDFRIPMMSLPHAFRTTMDSIPSRSGYLTVDDARVAHWQERLASDNLKVGVTWSGNPKHKNDRARSIPLKTLLPLFADRNCQFYLLQKDVRESDCAHIPSASNVHNLSASLTDFTETAAIIKQLDVVISVDTAVAHLAAGLGTPTWILTPTPSDFRWMLEGEKNPWYESARVFRQQIAGDWNGPIRQIKQALGRLNSSQATSSISEND